MIALQNHPELASKLRKQCIELQKFFFRAENCGILSSILTSDYEEISDESKVFFRSLDELHFYEWKTTKKQNGSIVETYSSLLTKYCIQALKVNYAN